MGTYFAGYGNEKRRPDLEYIHIFGALSFSFGKSIGMKASSNALDSLPTSYVAWVYNFESGIVATYIGVTSGN